MPSSEKIAWGSRRRISSKQGKFSGAKNIAQVEAQDPSGGAPRTQANKKLTVPPEESCGTSMMRIMNFLTRFLDEYLHFFNAFRNKMSTVGALLPTSTYAAQAMASECARHPGPKRVLEIGAGTGAITSQIVKHIGPDDALVCVELEPDLAEYLQRRFETEPEFERVRGRTQINQMSVLDLPVDENSEPFDYIISALPFNSLPPEFCAGRVCALPKAAEARGRAELHRIYWRAVCQADVSAQRADTRRA
ncbi:MAG: methyltransferase domain-containing protein [Anaerolineae bacterium]|nr:methyltransferase domain-containing protein [Anaerolineae bacterium]